MQHINKAKTFLKQYGLVATGTYLTICGVGTT